MPRRSTGPKDEAKARKRYDKAHAAGDSDTIYNLATRLLQGQSGPRDEAKARELYDKAHAAYCKSFPHLSSAFLSLSP